MNLEINKFQDMINQFKEIKFEEIKDRKTFMQVTGYPHFENVCSNVLAFFFCDSEEHKMKDLWTRALMEEITKGDIVDFSNTNTEREYHTEKGNRLDIVIMNDPMVIGIENKIFSSVYNDLEDYSNTIKSIAKDEKQKTYNIVLSLKDEHYVAENSGFVNITYDMLFNNVKRLLGEYIEEANNTWIIFMKDFIKTIMQLKMGETEMNKEFLEFMGKNNDNVVEFLCQVENFRKEIKQKTASLKNYLEDEDRLESYKRDLGLQFDTFCFNTKSGIYSSIYIDIKCPSGKILTVETFINYLGWHITLFDRKGSSKGKNEIESKLKNLNIESYEAGKAADELMKVGIFRCEYDASYEDVQKAIYDALVIAKKIL